MAARLPSLACRRAPSGLWWRPGLPVHPRPEAADYTLADAVLSRLPGWEVEAMRWTPGDPILEFLCATAPPTRLPARSPTMTTLTLF